MSVEWYAKDVLKQTQNAVRTVSKDVAQDVERDAKRILKQKADKTTADGLLSQFEVQKSKFKDGGYVVIVQGPVNWRPPYHASFLEMGTYKDEAKPFLRPATKKNRRRANRMYQEALL